MILNSFINKKKKITKKLSEISKKFYNDNKHDLVHRKCFICNHTKSKFLNKSHTFYNTVQCSQCLSKRIDPIFDEKTAGFNEIVRIEEHYLDSYLESPFKTDFKLFR